MLVKSWSIVFGTTGPERVSRMLPGPYVVMNWEGRSSWCGLAML